MAVFLVDAGWGVSFGTVSLTTLRGTRFDFSVHRLLAALTRL